MKAKDIKVNGEYLVNSSHDWNTQSFNSGTGWGSHRVRVLDATVSYWTYSTKTHQYEKTSYGFRARKGILVQVVDPETGVDVPEGSMVVTLASVRGSWAETSEQVRKNRAERAAYEAQKQSAKIVRQGMTADALKLAEKLGVKAKSTRWDDDGDVQMSPAQLLKILTALEASGWSADGQ